MDGYLIDQIQMPEPENKDPHPCIMLNGRGLHAGKCVKAWLPPEGRTDIRLEGYWDIQGP